MIHQELQTAEKYSNMTSEKIKRTLTRLRQEGHVFGNAKYGYKHIKINGIRTRVEDNQEQQNISKIVKQFKNYKNKLIGVKNIMHTKYISNIVRWCNRTGLKYRNNKSYTIAQLKNIIKLAIPVHNQQQNHKQNHQNNDDDMDDMDDMDNMDDMDDMDNMDKEDIDVEDN
jgi:DNA invertase Pin-like site-specific DNA recombinase